MNHVSERTIEYGSNHQSSCWSKKPSVRNKHTILLQCTEHIAPARHRLVNSEGQKGESYFRANVSWSEQGSLGQQTSGEFWKDVSSKKVKIRRSEATRCQNIVAASRAEY